MKIIFLDFDGVINSQASFLLQSRRTKAQRGGMPINETLCDVCCSNLQYILECTPGSKIVITSTWRELFDLNWLKNKLQSYGVDSSAVIDKTPANSKKRGEQISEWLDAHPEVQDNFVILDDNDDGISELFGESGTHLSYFVKTTWQAGLDLSHAIRAIKILGGHANGQGLSV